ncbi:hypothetical protein LBMAG47_08060 [Planctomycetia bacterium]|nr:hypothetical protein LBMAG47_08060 [Planctomycetia bacterium]
MSVRPLACFAVVAVSLTFASGLVSAPPARAADEPVVLAVAACDPYADLKKQVRWVGGLVDQPGLDALVETPLMMATQFKGLAGLDVGRPAGVVVTAEGPAAAPVVRGFVPVKDLKKLVESLAPVLGDVEERDGVMTFMPNGMPPLQIVEKEGWAIVSLQGMPAAPAGLEQQLDPVVKMFSVGAKLFPARLPEQLQAQLQAVLGQAAAMQGQNVDAEALTRQIAALETLMLGLTLDIEKARAFVELRQSMTAGSAEGKLFDDMAQATLTAPTAATADGNPAAISGHAAVAIPESLRKDAAAALELPAADPVGTALVAVLRQIVPSMLDAGAIDASLTVDTAAANPEAGQPVPAVTACMKLKDGRAVEAAVKKALGAADALPAGVSVRFDTGKAGAATLHTVEVDLSADRALSEMLGKNLGITLGMTPDRAIVALGGGAEKRIAALTDAAPPGETAKPFGGLDVSLVPLLRYSAALPTAAGNPAALEALNAALDKAATLPSSALQLLVRPLERGMALRLSADAGAIRLLKDVFTMQAVSPAPVQPGLGRRPPKPNAIPLPDLAP